MGKLNNDIRLRSWRPEPVDCMMYDTISQGSLHLTQADTIYVCMDLCAHTYMHCCVSQCVFRAIDEVIKSSVVLSVRKDAMTSVR